MQRLDLKRTISDCIVNKKIALKGRVFAKFLENIKDFLFLYQQEGETTLEKLYLFYYDIDIPLCKECGKKLKFYNFNIGYRTFCSSICSNNNKEKQVKSKKTLLENYGVSTTFLLESSKKTKLERYGNENYNNRILMKQTKLERYGNENYNNIKK